MADVTEVLVPDLGDFADVPVIEVLVEEGQEVSEDEPLIVLESDKASMEVPSTAAGVVADIVVGVGDEVSQGDVIVRISDDGSSPEADEPEQEEPDEEAEEDPDDEEPEQEEPADEEPADEEPDEPVEDDEDEEEADEEESAADDGDGEGGDGDDEDAYAGPGARRLARELGVALEDVDGSGQKGRITKEDIRAAADAPDGEKEKDKEEPAAAPSGEGGAVLDLAPWPTVDYEQFGPVERVELSRLKRIAGPYLSRNWVLIPHVTQHDEADVTDLEAFRKEVNAEHEAEGVKLTMVSLLLKASAAALRAFPEFNSSLDGDAIVVKRYHHLGFAVDTPDGLVVPVIRDVDKKGLLEIARELTDLSGRARDGKLKREDIEGGTFSISSLGGIGGTAFTPIINAPEVAVLGVSRTKMAPVWNGREFAPRLMLPLSLSYDHRVIDGAAAARFTTHLGTLLSDPKQMLL